MSRAMQSKANLRERVQLRCGYVPTRYPASVPRRCLAGPRRSLALRSLRDVVSVGLGSRARVLLPFNRAFRSSLAETKLEPSRTRLDRLCNFSCEWLNRVGVLSAVCVLVLMSHRARNGRSRAGFHPAPFPNTTGGSHGLS